MRKPRPPNYEALESAEWRRNAQAVPEELRSGSERLLTRIRLFVSRFGFAEKSVKRRVERDKMFAAHFAKEPRRTGLHERYAAEWIAGLPTVQRFRTLPKGGPKAIYITSDGNIQRGPIGNRPGKSLDFTWKTGNKTCYAMHKFTKQGGGHQDSAHQEMVDLLRNFQSCNDRSCALFVIVDGAYFRGSKMQQLRNHLRDSPPRSYALPIEDLPDILTPLSRPARR